MPARTTAILLTTAAIGALFALSIPEPIAAEIPNDAVTPGVVASTDITDVCGIVGGLSYSKRHRATPAGLKAMIRKRDGCDPAHSEVDHRLPLALGGGDVVYNLWCQPELGVTWDYHDKDRLEVWVWESTCKHHALTLPEAQAMFMVDWRVSYCRVFTGDPRCGK